jgi:hypothetical protein
MDTQATEVPAGAGQGNVHEVALLGSLVRFTPSDEARFILLVIVAEALGSYIHTATSFADYVGNRQMYSSWVWWYVLRTFIGLCLALIFYFVLRGGLLSAGATSEDISPFGIAAVSGMVGMFSKQATDQLSELFDNIFKTDRVEKRADKLTTHPMPKIESIIPDGVPLAGADLVLIVKGINFVPASVVRFKGADQPTTFVDSTQLIVRIPASDLAKPGEARLTVLNPAPGGGQAEEIVQQEILNFAKQEVS